MSHTVSPRSIRPWLWLGSRLPVQRREYTDATGRVVYVQVHGGMAGPSWNWSEEDRGLLEEHRYDALGRQVLVWQRRDLAPTPPPSSPLHSASCLYFGCESAVIRTVWAGDQALYEIRTAASDSTAHLDHVAELDRPPTDVMGERGSTAPWGLVLNVFGDALDEPMAVIRGWDTHPATQPQRILLPHVAWRGMAVSGSDAAGQLRAEHVWIGRTATLDHALSGVPGVGIWVWDGTRLADAKEASGLLNRRNRMYDPASGRFTSADPIGLAGGMNPYLFGAGSPIDWDDPFGFKPRPRKGSGVVDLAAGLLPGVSTIDDAMVLAFGRTLSGTPMAGADRLIAAVGLVSPVSGGEIRTLIGSYRELRKLTKGVPGLEVHHLIEKRLASVLGISDKNGMLGIVLFRSDHQPLTNAWRGLIPYGESRRIGISRGGILEALRKVHGYDAKFSRVLEKLLANMN